jgi:Lon protease-like protein
MKSSQSFFLFLGGAVLLLPMASYSFHLRPDSRTSPNSKTSSLTAPSPKRLGRGPFPLRSISEWRDLWFDFPTTTPSKVGAADSTTSTPVLSQLPLKEVCILPFPFSDVLLQGETKQLRLYEERFIKLFDDCMTNHCGVVAMGLVAETGIIQTVPLCEVEAYHRMEGFGIFVTIRVVGRAKLSQITKQSPYLKAKCRELTDDIPPNLELPSLVASNIENFMLLLSSMEHRLAEVRERDMNKDEDDDDDDDDDDNAEMQRRIQIAKLVRFILCMSLLF